MARFQGDAINCLRVPSASRAWSLVILRTVFRGGCVSTCPPLVFLQLPCSDLLMRNNGVVRDTLTAIGGGSTFVGMIFLLGGDAHPQMELAGKVLIVIGIVLFIVKVWKHWQSGA